MALSACATTSWSSPAIRVRSSRAAASAAAARSRSARSAFACSAWLRRVAVAQCLPEQDRADADQGHRAHVGGEVVVVGLDGGADDQGHDREAGAHPQAAPLGVRAERVAGDQQPQERAGDVLGDVAAEALQHGLEREDEQHPGEREPAAQCEPDRHDRDQAERGGGLRAVELRERGDLDHALDQQHPRDQRIREPPGERAVGGAQRSDRLHAAKPNAGAGSGRPPA
jgi:hypothetical protein